MIPLSKIAIKFPDLPEGLMSNPSPEVWPSFDAWYRPSKQMPEGHSQRSILDISNHFSSLEDAFKWLETRTGPGVQAFVEAEYVGGPTDQEIEDAIQYYIEGHLAQIAQIHVDEENMHAIWRFEAPTGRTLTKVLWESYDGNDFGEPVVRTQIAFALVEAQLDGNWDSDEWNWYDLPAAPKTASDVVMTKTASLPMPEIPSKYYEDSTGKEGSMVSIETIGNPGGDYVIESKEFETLSSAVQWGEEQAAPDRKVIVWWNLGSPLSARGAEQFIRQEAKKWIAKHGMPDGIFEIELPNRIIDLKWESEHGMDWKLVGKRFAQSTATLTHRPEYHASDDFGILGWGWKDEPQTFNAGNIKQGIEIPLHKSSSTFLPLPPNIHEGWFSGHRHHYTVGVREPGSNKGYVREFESPEQVRGFLAGRIGPGVDVGIRAYWSNVSESDEEERARANKAWKLLGGGNYHWLEAPIAHSLQVSWRADNGEEPKIIDFKGWNTIGLFHMADGEAGPHYEISQHDVSNSQLAQEPEFDRYWKHLQTDLLESTAISHIQFNKSAADTPADVIPFQGQARYIVELWRDNQLVTAEQPNTRQEAWQMANRFKSSGTTVLYAYIEDHVDTEEQAAAKAASGEWPADGWLSLPAGVKTEVRWICRDGKKFERPPRIKSWERTDRFVLNEGVAEYFDTIVDRMGVEKRASIPLNKTASSGVEDIVDQLNMAPPQTYLGATDALFKISEWMIWLARFQNNPGVYQMTVRTNREQKSWELPKYPVKLPRDIAWKGDVAAIRTEINKQYPGIIPADAAGWIYPEFRSVSFDSEDNSFQADIQIETDPPWELIGDLKKLFEQAKGGLEWHQIEHSSRRKSRRAKAETKIAEQALQNLQEFLDKAVHDNDFTSLFHMGRLLRQWTDNLWKVLGRSTSAEKIIPVPYRALNPEEAGEFERHNIHRMTEAVKEIAMFKSANRMWQVEWINEPDQPQELFGTFNEIGVWEVTNLPASVGGTAVLLAPHAYPTVLGRYESETHEVTNDLGHAMKGTLESRIKREWKKVVEEGDQFLVRHPDGRYFRYIFEGDKLNQI